MRGLPAREQLSELGPLLTRIAAVGGLCAVVIAAGFVLFGSGSTYEVRAVFEDVRGLIPGGEVKAGAEVVGQVEEIEFDENGLPVVTMSIDDDLQLRQGAFADIRLASNLGGVNRYVDLTIGEGPPLPDGATLGPSATDQPVDLDIAVSDLDPQTRAEVAAVLAGVDESLKGRGADLGRALRHSAEALGETAALLDQVNRDSFALRRLVINSREVVGALAESPADLSETAERLAAVLTVTANRQLELARGTRAFGPALASGRELLERLDGAIPELRGLAVAARPAAEELTPTARVIRPAIAALGPLLDESQRLVDAAPRQLRRLSPVLEAAVPLIRRLEPLMRGLGPTVDYLRVYAPEVTSFFLLWSDATSNFDAAGKLSRLAFTPIPTAAHTNLLQPFAGPIAGLVKRPFYRTPGSLEGESQAWRGYARSFIGGARPVESFIEPDEEDP